MFSFAMSFTREISAAAVCAGASVVQNTVDTVADA
jgi:hypothetical protein